MKVKLETIGYWNEIGIVDDCFIDPKKIMNNPNWENWEKDKIINYLNQGIVYIEYCGFSYDRINPNTNEEVLGNTELTDGEWSWPSGLVYYVKNYEIELPLEFLTTMRKHNFEIIDRSVLKFNLLENINYEIEESTEFWRNWCNWKNFQ